MVLLNQVGSNLLASHAVVLMCVHVVQPGTEVVTEMEGERELHRD